MNLKYKDIHIISKGGPGSGHFRHSGRPGKIGGSLPRYSPGIAPKLNSDDPNKWNITAYSNSRIPLPFQESLEMHKFLSAGVMSWYRQEHQLPEDLTSEEYEALKWIAATEDNKMYWKNDIVTNISKSTKEDYDLVNKVLQQWAVSSNGNDIKSLSLQEAASEEFGIPLSSWQQKQLQELRDDKQHAKWLEALDPNNELDMFYASRYYPITDRKTERKILRAIYNYTQKQLRLAGFKPNDTIKIFRGINSKNVYHGMEYLKPGIQYNHFGNMLESWSAGSTVAMSFGSMMLSMEIPIKSIFSTAKTGMGCLSEGEIIIFGSIPGHVGIILDDGNRL